MDEGANRRRYVTVFFLPSLVSTGKESRKPVSYFAFYLGVKLAVAFFLLDQIGHGPQAMKHHQLYIHIL